MFEISKKGFTLIPSVENAVSSAKPQRRIWTGEEVAELVTVLASLRTSDVAKVLGVNSKALRSLLRRNGISLRSIRKEVNRTKEDAQAGLVIRRSSIGPSAIYGAAALEALEDKCCRWPNGDPASPEFSFCGAAVKKRGSYCDVHRALAYEVPDLRRSKYRR